MPSSSQSASEGHRAHIAGGDDVSLALNLPAGCEECFAMIFHRYCKLVFTVAWRILRDKSDAEDVVQEVFLTIFQGRNLYDSSRGTVSAWIGHFAQLRALSKLRSLHLRQLVPIEDESASEVRGNRVEDAQNIAERTAFVQQCLDMLTPRQRRTIELIHFDGYTLLETAGLLNETLANTRNLYYRGMKSLRTNLHSSNKMRQTACRTERKPESPIEEGSAVRFVAKS